VLCLGFELIDAHAGERGRENFKEVIRGEFGDRLAVAGEYGFEWLYVLKFGLRSDQRWYTL
jgi:hypothetical protein